MDMRITKLGKALLCAAALAVSACGLAAQPAYAAEGCRVNVVCDRENKPVAGAEWSIFKAAEKNEDGEYTLVGDFAEYPVDLSGVTETSQMQDIADTLESYTKTDSLTAVSTAVTDEQGIASLTVDGAGLYLVTGKSFDSETQKFTPSAMFVEVDDKVLGEGEMTVYAKYTIEDITEEADFSVKKTWVVPNNDEKAIPKSVKVEIYCDGEVKETVTLDASNKWEYAWKGDGKSEWAVKEIDVPESFTVVTKNSGGEFSITNSYKGSSGDNSQKTSSVPEKLPQTGALNWPVPVLAGCGIVFIAAGWRISRKSK